MASRKEYRITLSKESWEWIKKVEKEVGIRGRDLMEIIINRIKEVDIYKLIAGKEIVLEEVRSESSPNIATSPEENVQEVVVEKGASEKKKEGEAEAVGSSGAQETQEQERKTEQAISAYEFFAEKLKLLEHNES